MMAKKISWCWAVFGVALALLGWPVQSETTLAQPGAVPRPLRVAINHGNAVLARRDERTGQLSGVSVDMAHELGRRLGVEVRLVGFDAANKSVQALREQAVDVGFFAVDPQRSGGLLFTASYVVIEGAYAVQQHSPIQKPNEVDRLGIRVAVADKSAYDLYLTRTLQYAQLVKTVRSNEVVDLMLSTPLEVAAGVKQQLEKDMQKHPGLRLLQPSFMQIQQAMATSASQAELYRELRHFVEDVKASGFVQQALQRHGIEGAEVAPAAATP